MLRAHLTDRARHSRTAVIVSCNRKRPTPQLLIILSEKLSGRVRGLYRVAALIHVIVDLHEQAARGTRKLPDAGRAEAGVCSVIEGRFYVGEVGKIHWKAVLLKNSSHVLDVESRPGDPLTELFAQSLLGSHVSGGPSK